DVDEVGEDALPHDIRGIALGRHSVSHTNSILPHYEARAGGCRKEVLCYSRHLRGRSSAAEHQLPKLRTRVRFPSPALDTLHAARSARSGSFVRGRPLTPRVRLGRILTG